MAKRKHPMSTRASKPPVSPASAPSSLLRLPAEIRTMIWKAVADTPILVKGVRWPRDDEFIESSCIKFHGKQTLKKKGTRAPGSLSWLRTNRQIYTEVQPIVYHNPSLHICHAMAFEALLSARFPNTHLKRRKIRSLSFCLRIAIEHDLREGYAFPRGVFHSPIGWRSGIHRTDMGPCHCFWCLAGLPHDGPALDKCFPKLEEVRLRVSFICHQGQGNDRPVIGRWKNGRVRHGRLYRPKRPSPLVWRDNEESLKQLVRDLCRKQPLGMLKGGRPKSLQVEFATQSIEHDPMNRCSHLHDRCWCKGRSVDLESLPKTLFTSVLQTQLWMT